MDIISPASDIKVHLLIFAETTAARLSGGRRGRGRGRHGKPISRYRAPLIKIGRIKQFPAYRTWPRVSAICDLRSAGIVTHCILLLPH